MAKRSEAANIADESASYVNGIERTEEASDKPPSADQEEDKVAHDE